MYATIQIKTKNYIVNKSVLTIETYKQYLAIHNCLHHFKTKNISIMQQKQLKTQQTNHKSRISIYLRNRQYKTVPQTKNFIFRNAVVP